LLTSEVERFKQQPVNSELIHDLNEIYGKFKPKFDLKWGGLDKEPKFIMPSIWLFLLRLSHVTKNQEALDHTVFTLKKIFMGGIYDQIGGGFSRYSVDRYWFAPHFEKMLYDNAQLMSLYSEAYSVTRDESFKAVVYETFQWVTREMTHASGGFYSALDADSEGVEGKFYIWTKQELREKLKEMEPAFSAYFGVKDQGNWEHGSNILMRTKEDALFIKEHALTEAAWKSLLEKSKGALLEERKKRISPGLDDKIIAGWNAMMVSGLIDAYKAFGDEIFLEAALRNIRFIEKELLGGNILYRSFKNRRSTIPGFLDDYAFYIQALFKLYEVTFDESWINRGRILLEHTIERFFDSSDGFFFYTSSESEKLISRKKEIFDNVIPASNAVMAQNLNYLGTFFDRDDWKKMSTDMTGSLSQIIKSEPGFMSYWAIVYSEIKKGLAEIVVTGKDVRSVRKELFQSFMPFSIVLGTESKSDLPLLKDKVPADGKPTIYVCYNKACKLPVHTVAEATAQLL
jgi:uncharacterized protein YyaL (SSP411 family)